MARLRPGEAETPCLLQLCSNACLEVVLVLSTQPSELDLLEDALVSGDLGHDRVRNDVSAMFRNLARFTITRNVTPRARKQLWYRNFLGPPMLLSSLSRCGTSRMGRSSTGLCPTVKRRTNLMQLPNHMQKATPLRPPLQGNLLNSIKVECPVLRAKYILIHPKAYNTSAGHVSFLSFSLYTLSYKPRTI